nr:MAG TPA: hypothetical protein [Crassvirales sp.]DAW72397.1 MAG TPA: hypothetical protein [Caudoviricetes sp.]
MRNNKYKQSDEMRLSKARVHTKAYKEKELVVSFRLTSN